MTESLDSHGEGSYGLSESPNIGLRNIIREELTSIRRESINALAVEIAEKGLAKLEIKDTVDRMYQYRSDVTIRQPLKFLGSIVVAEGISRLLYKNESIGFQIQKGDPYIDIHIPPLNDKEKKFVSIADSFEMVADYIKRHGIPGDYLIGITYERLAQASKRYGFTVLDLDLPPELTRGVENVYRKFRERYGQDVDMGKIQLCFQKREDFLNRFKKK